MSGTNIVIRRMRFKLLTSAAAVIVGATIASTAMSEPPPQVGTSKDSSHVFLTFSAGKSLAEDTTTAKNYMKAIDPLGAKKDFVSWLVKAGFISQPSDWLPSGQQTYTQQTSAAAAKASDYGPGKVNAYAHIIILNSADLGFIRNQYIRCIPDCATPNAKVYSYLENYGAQQFAQVDPVTGAGIKASAQTNNPAAVSIALEKRPVNLADGGHRIADVAFEWAPAANGSNPTHNFGQIYPYVILPRYQQFVCDGGAGGPDSVNGAILNGTFTGALDANNVLTSISGLPQAIDEQYIWPVGFGGANQAFYDCHFNLSTDNGAHGRSAHIPQFSDQAADATHVEFRNPPPDFKVVAGDIFAAELDTLGTKQTPGVCLICHGGNIPGNLATTKSWGVTGEISEFKFLPADAVNSIFGENDTGAAVVMGATGVDLTEPGQAAELRKYTQAAAITHGAIPPKNATFTGPAGSIAGTWSVGKNPDHALQVIFGWYQAADGDYAMLGSGLNPLLQQRDFVPVGWRSAKGSALYTEVIQRDCRSCHLNREPSLDFRTESQFAANQGNVQDYVFQPECDFINGEVNPSNITMPLARLTWERLWDGILGIPPNGFLLPGPNDNGGVIDNRTLFGAGSVPKATANSDINQLKAYFNYTPTSYCAAHH
jgi:hypothetical protein